MWQSPDNFVFLCPVERYLFIFCYVNHSLENRWDGFKIYINLINEMGEMDKMSTLLFPQYGKRTYKKASLFIGATSKVAIEKYNAKRIC